MCSDGPDRARRLGAGVRGVVCGDAPPRARRWRGGARCGRRCLTPLARDRPCAVRLDRSGATAGVVAGRRARSVEEWAEAHAIGSLAGERGRGGR
jgi:hypothetical protein